MDNKLQKSLTDLIDETLMELDELRKSRFSASEIKIEGPGDGIAGKPSDGDLHAKKAEDDKKEKEKDEDDKDMDKADCSMDKAEDKAEDKDDKDEDMNKKEDKDKDDDKHPKKKQTAEAAKDILDMHKYDMKKSLESSESLLKSYVEERVKPLEDKLSTILDLVNKIADAPVAPKGATARVTPLLKSADEGAEPLSKAQVASKLFELKKSGTRVDSLDITKAEMGQDLQQIAKKYEIS
jgi:hypothetical protein